MSMLPLATRLFEAKNKKMETQEKILFTSNICSGIILLVTIAYYRKEEDI